MPNPDPSLPHSNRIWNVQPDEAGQRLDRYLVSMLQDISRTTVQQLISDGMVLINGQPSKPGYALRSGDEVRVLTTTPASRPGNIKPNKLPLDIVYEDSDLLVVNKAAGVVVHPAPGDTAATIVGSCPPSVGRRTCHRNHRELRRIQSKDRTNGPGRNNS